MPAARAWAQALHAACGAHLRPPAEPFTRMPAASASTCPTTGSGRQCGTQTLSRFVGIRRLPCLAAHQGAIRRATRPGRPRLHPAARGSPVTCSRPDSGATPITVVGIGYFRDDYVYHYLDLSFLLYVAYHSRGRRHGGTGLLLVPSPALPLHPCRGHIHRHRDPSLPVRGAPHMATECAAALRVSRTGSRSTMSGSYCDDPRGCDSSLDLPAVLCYAPDLTFTAHRGTTGRGT